LQDVRRRSLRFISEDPLGFAAGDVNLHAYTSSSPTNLTDSSGLIAPMVAGCLFGGISDASLNLWADFYTGRKSSWTDVFSFATVRYAATGCVWDATFGAFGEIVGAAAEAVLPIGPAAVLSGELGGAGAGTAGGEAGATGSELPGASLGRRHQRASRFPPQLGPAAILP
jgi:hypothetical protein